VLAKQPNIRQQLQLTKIFYVYGKTLPAKNPTDLKHQLEARFQSKQNSKPQEFSHMTLKKDAEWFLQNKKQHLLSRFWFLFNKLSLVRVAPFVRYHMKTLILSGIFNFQMGEATGTSAII
jgi:hypothetical protein